MKDTFEMKMKMNTQMMNMKMKNAYESREDENSSENDGIPTENNESINQTCMPVGSPFGRRRSAKTNFVCTIILQATTGCRKSLMSAKLNEVLGEMEPKCLSCANICHSSICKNRAKAASLVTQLCLLKQTMEKT